MYGYLLLLFLCFSMLNVYAQFDVDAYKEFLLKNKHLTTDQLLEKYPAGTFSKNLRTEYQNAEYFSLVDQKLGLTTSEKSLLSKHSFVVTERKSYPSFNAAFHDVYVKDLPVYISSDALLHALHRSYDNLLKDLEQKVIIGKLDSALRSMHQKLRSDSTVLHTTAIEEQAFDDADVYITIALRLLNTFPFSGKAPHHCVKPENTKELEKLLALIKKEEFTSTQIFSKTPRLTDFSQFIPRGHYNDKQELSAYFRCMMWLGRTELYITAPKSDTPVLVEDIQRQNALAITLAELIQNSTAEIQLRTIDKIITAFVGKQDNITTDTLNTIIADLHISVPDVQDSVKLQSFQHQCIKAGAAQSILSQVLVGDGINKIEPAAAYMVMGQRFIVDSYILSQVVHDKVNLRMMPNALDAMFALGNNSALQLLVPDLHEYGYAPQAASLRYLIDTYREKDWNSSLYGTWLNSIRALNPPPQPDREKLPEFMRTAAWWQKTLNTQLASWAELRHDNLLYAKQSYTGGLGCFYPAGFVEPVPELYTCILQFTKSLDSSLLSIIPNTEIYTTISSTLSAYETVCKTLNSIAIKELNSQHLSDDEVTFLKNWVIYVPETLPQGCVVIEYYDGWYSKLFYGVEQIIGGEHERDFVVADVHTQPTDEYGNQVGKVLHVGTGAPTLAIIIATDADGCATTYCGPVSSYYEHTSNNFIRITDEEWKESYTNKGLRPELTNLYMANRDGESLNTNTSLITNISEISNNDMSRISIQSTSFPNPFTTSVVIGCTVPQRSTWISVEHPVIVQIYSSSGALVSEIHNKPLPAGNYTFRWDGTNSSGQRVSHGAYTYQISVGGATTTGLLVFK